MQEERHSKLKPKQKNEYNGTEQSQQLGGT